MTIIEKLMAVVIIGGIILIITRSGKTYNARVRCPHCGRSARVKDSYCPSCNGRLRISDNWDAHKKAFVKSGKSEFKIFMLMIFLFMALGVIGYLTGQYGG